MLKLSHVYPNAGRQTTVKPDGPILITETGTLHAWGRARLKGRAKPLSAHNGVTFTWERAGDLWLFHATRPGSSIHDGTADMVIAVEVAARNSAVSIDMMQWTPKVESAVAVLPSGATLEFDGACPVSLTYEPAQSTRTLDALKAALGYLPHLGPEVVTERGDLSRSLA